MSVNPIQIPGINQNPMATLNPTRHSGHKDYFVDVDNTAEAFQKFQESFGNLESWVHQGAIAIAAGGEQSGKSALLNRCAYWLKPRFDNTTMSAIILDLTWVPVVAQQSMSTRMKLVCHHLVNTLWHDKHLVDESVREQQDPEDILPYLPRMLRQDLVIIVLLPRTADVVDELVEYAKLVPERVILLCETAFIDRLDLIADRFNTTRVTPMTLRVGTLRPSDGDMFYNERRRLHPVDADIPNPAPGLLQRLLSIKGMSIGEFQRLLYEVYSEVPDLQPPISEVTYEIITEYYIRKTTFGGPQ